MNKTLEIAIVNSEHSKGSLAKAVNIAPGTLSKIIKEVIPTLPVGVKIARELNTTVEDLWGSEIK